VGLILLYLLAARFKLLPSMQSLKDFVDAFNSAGMHIVLLSAFSAWSVMIAVRYIYHVLTLPQETLTKGEAMIAVGISFVTGQLSGQFIGALLKTMSGGKANGAPPPAVPDALHASVVPAPEKKL